MLLNGDLMQLDEYLKSTGQRQSDFGAALHPPATQALVSQWVRGVTRVTLAHALQINKVTNGQVTPQDCADMYRRASASHLPAPSPQPA